MSHAWRGKFGGMSTIIMQEMRKLIKRPLKYRPYPAQHSRMFNQHQQFESSTNCYVFQGLTTWSLTHPLSRFFKFVALIFYPTSWHKNMFVYLPSLLFKYYWWEGGLLLFGLFSHLSCHDHSDPWSQTKIRKNHIFLSSRKVHTLSLMRTISKKE